MRRNLIKIIDCVDSNGLFDDGDWIESKDQDPNGEIRLIQLADIGDGEFLDVSNRFVNKETAKRLRCTFLEQGDILVARMPDPLGRCCIFPFSTEYKYITAVDVCIIRSKTGVNNVYLKYIINSPPLRQKIWNNRSGTTRARITRKKLGEFQVPLPPLPEQRRIVAKLDSLFERIVKAITLVEKNLKNAQSLMASVLDDVFEDSEWDMVPFHSVVSNNAKTIVPSPNEQYNIIGLENISRNTGRLVDFRPMFGRESRSNKVMFAKGTVLYGKLRPYLNKVYVAEFDGIASTEILPFITDSDCLLPTFLAAYLRSPRFLERVNENCAGARMPRVTTKFWNDVMVPQPSTTVQKQIVNYLCSIEKEQDSLHRKQQMRLAELLALKSSLLDAAFKGEL